MYAPNWLLLYPGFIFLILGLVLGGTIVVDKITINNINFSIHTLLYCACLIIIGLSIMQMYLIVKVYAYNHNFLPKKQTDWNHKIREDRIIAIGAGIVILGIVLSIIAVETWKASSMGDLNAEQTMRIVIPAVLCLIVGFQSIFTGFMVGVMKIRTETSI